MKTYINEFHDIRTVRAAEMGFVLPSFGEAHDEQESQAELESRVMKGRGALEALCAHALPGLPLRDACEMCGARVCALLLLMGARLPVALAQGARKKSDVRYVAVAVTESEVVEALKVLIVGERDRLGEVGRWFMLVAYALCPNPLVKDVLRSVEHIGHLWELRAANKRSAVSAAMRVLKGELKRHWRFDEEFHFWFEKSAEAKAAYARVQEGNHNRSGSVVANDENSLRHTEGGMRTPEGRRLMQRLAHEAEARRLAKLCGCKPEEIDVRRVMIGEGRDS